MTPWCGRANAEFRRWLFIPAIYAVRDGGTARRETAKASGSSCTR
jgi:hypothetical protein